MKLLMGDQGLIVGGFGAGDRKFRFGMCCPGRLGDVLIARGDER
jgi:hypothetical protein